MERGGKSNFTMEEFKKQHLSQIQRSTLTVDTLLACHVDNMYPIMI